MSGLLSRLFGAGRARPERRTVLFITHDDFRAGAQLLLLQFLRWLKEESDLRFEILVKNLNGDLVDDFRALAPVTIWNDPPGHEPDTARVDSFKDHLRQADVGLVYSNTFTNGSVLEALADLDCPTITHVHELAYWIANRTEPGNNEQVLRHSNHFVAASKAVTENLVSNLAIPDDRITLVHEFVPTNHTDPRVSPQEIRDALGIPDHGLVVGGCGTLDWRKGVDLFIPLAQALREVSGRPVHFVWVGGDTSAAYFTPLRHDLEHAGLEHRVHFVGVQQNPLDYFQIFDAFALTSREDPFPLVALEAASLGKPIVCFDGAGGIGEFVETDCGFIVPYLDLLEMASRLGDLLGSTELRERLGRTARDKVRRRHDIRIGGPQLLGVVERFLKPGARTGR